MSIFKLILFIYPNITNHSFTDLLLTQGETKFHALVIQSYKVISMLNHYMCVF